MDVATLEQTDASRGAIKSAVNVILLFTETSGRDRVLHRRRLVAAGLGPPDAATSL